MARQDEPERDKGLTMTAHIQEQTAKYDPWAGLGMSIEELASKVEALEKDNDELAAGAHASLDAYKQRLLDAGSKEVEVA